VLKAGRPDHALKKLLIQVQNNWTPDFSVKDKERLTPQRSDPTSAWFLFRFWGPRSSVTVTSFSMLNMTLLPVMSSPVDVRIPRLQKW
jgi:hypothetical protein